MIFEKTDIAQAAFAQAVPKILGGMTSLLIKKNADYGGASMDLGLAGVVVHLHDKITRLRSLFEKNAGGETPNFESLEDTLRDTIGYATIGLVIQESKKPMATDAVWEALRERADSKPLASIPVPPQNNTMRGIARLDAQDLSTILTQMSTSMTPAEFSKHVWDTIIEILKRDNRPEYLRAVANILFLRETI